MSKYFLYDGRAWGEWAKQDSREPYEPDRASLLYIADSLHDAIKSAKYDFSDVFVVDEDHNYVHIKDHPCFKEQSKLYVK